MCKHWGLGHINKNSLTSGKPCLENGELKYIKQCLFLQQFSTNCKNSRESYSYNK